MPYLVENDRLSAHQSGNKKWHSTKTSLIYTSDRILTAIDQKKTSAVVLLDMSRAFDSVNHDILLKKLQDIGLSPSTILWFKSYLSNRYQAVRINTALSEPLLMRYGVPQGSILGPLLFTAYNNDLPSIPQHCSTDCYVDDNKLLMSFQVQDCEPTMAAMNDDLIKLRNWCFNNSLLLNPDKTQLIVYGSRQMISKLQDFRLTLLGKELLPVDSVKDLGVVFDSKLSFNDHIIKTPSSCMSALGQISRVKHIFRKDILVTTINSLVFSKLYYCSSVWSNTSARNIRKLQGVQDFAARIVSGTRKFDHVSPALKDLRWIPVKSHLYLRDAILAFKSMTGQVPNYLSSNFISRGNKSGRTTRSSSQLNIPLFKTKSGQRSFYYRTVTLWNALKPHFKLSESLIIFKRKMKAFLLNQFLMS